MASPDFARGRHDSDGDRSCARANGPTVVGEAQQRQHLSAAASSLGTIRNARDRFRRRAHALAGQPYLLTLITRHVTILRVIRSFADVATERLFGRQSVSRWSAALQRTALRKLVMLDAAEELRDLRVPPGNRLERLAGKRGGQYSIRVNEQWRVCFRWRDGDAYDVEIVDYH